MGGSNNTVLLAAYTAFLRDTSWYVHAHENNAPEFSYLFHGLCGETGEANDAFKKVIRETGYFNQVHFEEVMNNPEMFRELVSELGDVLWYLTRIADKLGLTLEDLAVLNTRKLFMRLKDLEKIAPTYPWPLPRHQFPDDRVIKLFGTRDSDPNKYWEADGHE